jgi:hypothetical protein
MSPLSRPAKAIVDCLDDWNASKMPVAVLHFTTKFFNLSWLVVGLACAFSADQVCAQTHFDYHTVRGRNPLASAQVRFEGETDFAADGNSRLQQMQNYGKLWSGDAYLLWAGAINDALTNSFEVQAAGTYDIAIQLTVAPDYGTFEVTMDGPDIRIRTTASPSILTTSLGTEVAKLHGRYETHSKCSTVCFVSSSTSLVVAFWTWSWKMPDPSHLSLVDVNARNLLNTPNRSGKSNSRSIVCGTGKVTLGS